MEYSESTHSLVNIKKTIFDCHSVVDIKDFSSDVFENVRLLKDSADNNYHLLVLDKLDGNTEFWDLTNKLRKKNIRPEILYVGREELANVTSRFDMSLSLNSESQSDTQNIVVNIIRRAVELRASDIHFLVDASYFKVAFRIDGIKRNIPQFEDSAENGKKILNTLFNSMCTEQSNNTLSTTDPSDARLKEEFVTEFGLSTGRFASRPGGPGTLLAVVRLITKRKQNLELESLGLTPKQVSSMKRVAAKTYGVIFSSGPTGHGKSTLSQCLAEFVLRSDTGINLLTVEDPLESPIKGAVQTPLKGSTWAEAIKNMMRLDPDFIYIGEVRDSGSAIGVIEAAQTGHNVITTIHTSNPIDIIQRLGRLGVEVDLLTDATLITCLIGLRLTPLLCPECKRPYSDNCQSVEPEIRETIERLTDPATLYMASEKGCEHCEGTGIKGRTGVFEVIETDYKFMSLYKEQGKFAAWQYWRSTGGETLCENLIHLVSQGKVDPVMAHTKICNFDRDEKFNE